MRSASRNCYVRIEAKTGTRDAATNEPLGAWAQNRLLWAHLRPKRARERESAGQVLEVALYLLSADFYDLDGVTNEMRVVYSPTGNYAASTDWVYFEIDAVLTDHVNRSETTLELRQATATTVGVV